MSSSAFRDAVLPQFSLEDGTDLGALPKVSLHDHLDGGLRPQTIIDIAHEHDLELPAHGADELAVWFADQADSGSLVEYLATFDVTLSVMQTADALARVAREFVEDLHADGVIYGEIRWAPEQHLGRGLSLDEAVDAVQGGIQDGIDSVARAGGRIRVGQLVSAMRQAGTGLEIAQLAVRHRDRGVVGFDIAGPEEGFPAGGLGAAFDFLAAHFMPTTVHAGEAAGLESIRGALLDGRALRLGHGVRLAEDLGTVAGGGRAPVSLGVLARWVRDRQIALELSPSSNLQTGAVAAWGTTVGDHPFDLLYRAGLRVTVNTDNRLMSNTTISRELALLTGAFGYGRHEIEEFQVSAAAASFLPLDERADLQQRIIEGFRAR